MRPTGAMHLGHYFGALRNWVNLQDKYETYYMVADWHALTTSYDNTAGIKESTYDMIKDWIACGIDPSKSRIFRQSDVPYHTELFLMLSMITPLGWLMRCPTYKEQLREIKNHDINTFGFLGYPVLQAADILMYKADCVPVGEDQLPHLEITRDIARRFNHLYEKIFPEPKALLTESPKLLGIDGRKMSKSYNNAINLSDEENDIRKKVNRLVTDPERIHASDKGHPEICSVFQYWKASNMENTADIETGCRNADIGCVQCKKMLAEEIVKILSPITSKRKDITREQLEHILETGGELAREKAGETLADAKRAVKI